MRRKMKEPKVELKKIVVYYTCETLGEKVQKVQVTEDSFYTQDSPCELCGSHGYTEVSIKCACGKNHDIKLKSW